MFRLLSSIAAAVALGVCSASAQDTKPLLVSSLARLEPLQIGQALIRRGERVGILLRVEDEDVSYQLPAGFEAADETITSEGLQLLSQRNRHYSFARSQAGVIRILPTAGHACAPYLKQPVGALDIEASVIDVLVGIVRTQNPDIPDEPAGLMGPISEAERQPFVQVIRYTFPGGTIEQALDAFVLAAPGTGWLIRENRSINPDSPDYPYCETTLFSANTIITGF